MLDQSLKETRPPAMAGFFMNEVNDQTLLGARSLTCGYGGEPVLYDVSLELKRGDFVGVIGPNGCGKSTLLRALTGVLAHSEGG